MSDCIVIGSDAVNTRLRVLRACQGMVGIAESAERWISLAGDEVLRGIRLECVVAVAPRALRDHGTAEALLQHAAHAEIWALGRGSTPSPAGNQKSRSHNVHAPNTIRRA